MFLDFGEESSDSGYDLRLTRQSYQYWRFGVESQKVPRAADFLAEFLRFPLKEQLALDFLNYQKTETVRMYRLDEDSSETSWCHYFERVIPPSEHAVQLMTTFAVSDRFELVVLGYHADEEAVQQERKYRYNDDEDHRHWGLFQW
eukprot:98398_1